MEEKRPALDVSNMRDILTIIFKFKYVISCVFIVVLAGVTLFAFNQSIVYEAKSVLLIKFGREFVPRFEVGSDRTNLPVTSQTMIQGEIGILKSLDLFSRVIDKIGPEKIYPGIVKGLPPQVTPKDAALRGLQENLVVMGMPNSNLINVSFTHNDPHIAALVVNTLVDFFKEKHLEVFSTTSTSFLEGQLKSFDNKLKTSEANLANFKQKYGIFSLEEQRANFIQQRGTFDSNLKTTLTQIREVEQRIAFIKSPRWNVEQRPEVRTSIMALQQRERELLEKYTENSGAVQGVRREMQAAQESARRTVEEARQIELSKAESELVVLQAKAESSRRQLAQIDSEIRSLDSRGRELQELKREAGLQEQNYQTYTKKLEESTISDDMDRRKMVAISVIENAVPSLIPKRGRYTKRQIIPMGFLGGFLAGIVVAFLLELMSPGMTTPLSAERRLGLPVLVAIAKK